MELNMTTLYDRTSFNQTNLISKGYWAPRDCIARQRLAVIVPYRNRELHLTAFLSHMHRFLQRQQLEYRIFIIEQVCHCYCQMTFTVRDTSYNYVRLG